MPDQTVPDRTEADLTEADQTEAGVDEPVMPPAPPFPAFENTPTLPHQMPGNGFESGRDSRAR
ncbi:hypothetical protein AB0F72_10410 [Actinoplanes sp. NPDC023936]|uniref:hypothetical protein n=1 Tax=Actinoplanes sp. NPDC023936 TaxID=3154910 RepID=UPI00340D7DA9